ncbi:hypothetical protein POM88_020917 [Heracleum sosnowskyi]|uniref:Uncharacterized protein n=1 Tax=Heracleum sosnowskyi TaxID=360622 RepID=A0AAD8ICA1_9APIA|nr:hypothetical protein POM88_020917 [Heracleum sosnowskyi]
MKNNHGKSKRRIKGWLKVPIRGLMKARDFYVRAMNKFAERFSYVDGVYACPTTQVTTLPRSFSLYSNTRDDDFSELVRVASTKCLQDRIDLDFQSLNASKIVARIDEAHSFDVCDNKVLNLKTADLFPRSRSFVVVAKTNK